MELYATTAGDEALLLDLLNTTPVIDGTATDLLRDLATAAAWLTDHDVAATEDELTGLVARARCCRPSSARPDPGRPGALPRPRPTASRHPDHGVDWRLTESTGATRAVLAWDGLRITSPGRLRPCANDECRLFLIDRSKPNTARWCSMAICGNRMKARRHYRRTHPD
ncbi:CGNR zinc finger domain-containing protein [Mycobacterium rufum]|uniref:CGNR zinc finger domain-containing protein n=1 Tax=Mycolicibacterium rufum TaxID=318424 RepID=A0A9X3BUF1_9MYCO|nr:CGNR zinc finger domain-containing protein [Mycolicibacterium rufum]